LQYNGETIEKTGHYVPNCGIAAFDLPGEALLPFLANLMGV